jgi:ketosteroid isomerase-like protein
MKSISIRVMALWCVFFSCSNTSGQDDEITKMITSIGDTINKAVLAGDFETFLSYCTDDVIMDPIFQPSIKGKKAYREELKKMKDMGVKYQSMSGTLEDVWKCGEMIYERGTFGMSMISKESPQPKAYFGAYFQIWKKQADGSYKLSYMISNLDFNPFGK